MKRLYIIVCLIALSLSMAAQSWLCDTLGGDFRVRFFNQGHDYAGNVRSCVVRLLPVSPSDKAVLYVHGFNDYFFQKEMACKFVDHDYGFYAVDLRRYGRSLLSGQKRCQVRNFNEYFADIDSALMVMRQDGFNDIILMGHSTGGLVASYYMSRNPESSIKALVLNSPFLDWNLGKMECFVGAISALGGILPSIGVSPGGSTAYGESLHKNNHGEWEFNTEWKSIKSPKVDLGWVRAVNSAQRYLRKHKYSINIPILLMYSAKSVDLPNWTPEASTGDAVLDVADIRHYGLLLGYDVTTIKVEGGMHDLILSPKNVREPLYTYIFQWLNRHLPAESSK